MAQEKLTDLPISTEASNNDMLYIVTGYENGSPTLTGTSKQISFGDFTSSITGGTSGTSGTSGISGDRYRTPATGEYTLGVVSGGTLIIEQDYGYSVAQSILVVYDKDNYQTSSVLSYDGETGELVFSGASSVVGSGTYTGWTINLAGAAGGDGSSGTSGTNGTSGSSGTNGTSGTSQKIVIQWDNKNQPQWNPNLWTIGGDIQYFMYGSTIYGSQQYGLRLTNATNQNGVMTSDPIPTSTFDPSKDFTAKFSLIYNSGSVDPGDGYLFFFGSDSVQPFNVPSTKGLRISVNEYVAYRNTSLFSANTLRSTQPTTIINYYQQKPFEYEIRKVTINGRTYLKTYLDGALDSNFDITGQSFTYGDRLNIGSITGAAFAVHWLIGFEIWQ